MSDIECNEELISLFDFKLGNSVGQNRSNKSPYFHLVFGEEYDKNINFSKPASIKLDKNEETIQISFGGTPENESSYLLSGQRFEDNTDEMDVEDAEKNYLLIFDEATKTYTLECLDYEFHIASYSDADLEREMESQLMQKEIDDEEDQLYTINGDDFVDEENYDELEEKFREALEIEGNEENGITYDEYEEDDDGDDAWMEDDTIEEVDAPSPRPVAEDDMYGPIEEDDDVTKDEISGSSNSSSSGVSSSSSSDSDNSNDDGSDSSELESEFGDIMVQMKQSMNSVAKSPRTKRDLNTAGGKRSNGDGNPISLGAFLGGADEQDQDDSTDDSD